MLKKILHDVNVFVEYHTKYFGLFAGLFIIAIVFPILLYVDYNVIADVNFIDTDRYGKLSAINTSLSGLLLSILLTTFSVVFVVMQLASTQFSPRILRHFLANDVDIQQFIGIYLGAIGLILMFQIVSAFDAESKFHVCLFASLATNLYCILVSFPGILAHINDNMNVATITNNIKNEISLEVDVLYADNWKKGDPLFYKYPTQCESNLDIPIYWPKESGYLSEVDYEKLKKELNALQSKHNHLPALKIYQRPIVGEFILTDTTKVFDIELDEAVEAKVLAQIEASFTEIATKVYEVNKFRSNKQDINFGVRKLVDIAIKAISPAVNDPTTCLNCVDYIGEVVKKLTVKKFPSSQTTDLHQHQIFVNEFEFDDLVNFSFDQIYQWGKKDPVVVKRIIKTICQILPFADNPYHLKVLISEVEEMELHKLYTLGLSTTDHTSEQIQSVQKELARFRKHALRQIDSLRQRGILAHYAQVTTTTDLLQEHISQAEVDCIRYLEAYCHP